MTQFRVGVDIGGTFTDFTAVDERTGELFHRKMLSRSADPGGSVAHALREARIPLEAVAYLSHGTTIAINALLERKGARTGILTTRGFRDVLELRRGARTHLLDPQMDKPPLFVPRRWRFEVSERVLSDGSVCQALDEDELRNTLRLISDVEGIESLAICFLNSYRNPVNERRAAEIAKSELPELTVTVSAALVPEIGEYERTSTAALNAYIKPVVRRYLSRLEAELRRGGFREHVYVMQSNGGVVTASQACEKPIHILESGPAAGVTGAASLGRTIERLNIVTLDMGGTTTKACVIEDGIPRSTVEFELFEEANKPGSGWPIRVPMIEIIELGAGGGSIAKIENGEGIQVGPESAGAFPGPVCYGLGATEPTITDANAVLGRLTHLLSGELPLDIAKARSVLQDKIGAKLKIGSEEAAAGVLEIADAAAADVIREVTVARGRDPRDFVLMAFGGAGPLQAAYILGELNMRQAIIPPAPGNFSALGLLFADFVHDAMRTHMSVMRDVDLEVLNRQYNEMELFLKQLLGREGIGSGAQSVARTADVRYRGQFHVLNIDCPAGVMTRSELSELEEAFHDEHLRLYNFASRAELVEIVNLRTRVVGSIDPPPFRRLDGRPSSRPSFSKRDVYFREQRKFLESRIYTRERLEPATAIFGPAVIEELSATTLIPPGYSAEVDEYGNILLAAR